MCAYTYNSKNEQDYFHSLFTHLKHKRKTAVTVSIIIKNVSYILSSIRVYRKSVIPVLNILNVLLIYTVNRNLKYSFQT